jgi:hypothetical protein
MVISENIEYKQKIAQRLIGIPDVYTLINNKTLTAPSGMINVNIFPYMKVPNIQTTVKNYICFDFNSRISPINEVLKNITINIGVVCHETEIMWNGLTRHDLLAGVITDSFNWSNFLGFELELVSDVESNLENDYHARTLQFRNISANSLKNKVMNNV